MRRYETIIIIDPDTPEEGQTSLIEKTVDIIPAQNGISILVDDWGVRKLAYEVKKKNRGHYVRFDYCGSGELVNELERSFRIDDRVIKYMTVLLEKDADAEAIKEEIAKAKEAQTAEQSIQKDAKGKAAPEVGTEVETTTPMDEGQETEPSETTENQTPEVETAIPEPTEPKANGKE
jgi:small subunit ribosomal protein S6